MECFMAPVSPLPIVLVDDHEPSLEIQKRVLLGNGYPNVATFCQSRQVLPFLEGQDAALIVLDLKMPELSGQELLKLLVARHPALPVIIQTSENQLETAIDCMRQGACDYLVKPLDLKKMLASVLRALELRTLNEKVLSLKRSPLRPLVPRQDDFDFIITRNSTMRELLRYLTVIAPTRQPVLILGETGVGKELFAQAVHQASGRGGPFVAVNVAGLDDTMFSDTLFGHKKGAFSGALTDREGLVHRAAGGTLFLDEIGDLPDSAQIRLLRLIQEQEYYRLGSDIPSTSDARVVIATNRDLKTAVSRGSFRRDLYYRLFAHQINIPPLRSRRDDLPSLLDSFVSYAAQSLGRAAPSYPQELITLLDCYPFPGNVRELQAMVFEAVARNISDKLKLELFKEIIKRERLESQNDEEAGLSSPSGAIVFSRFPTLKEAEDVLIAKALELAKSNQGVAASLLGISRPALNRRLNQGDAGEYAPPPPRKKP
jgi:two-component system, NtrC family, response regulator HydG